MKISCVETGIFFIAAMVTGVSSTCFAAPIPGVPLAAGLYVTISNPRENNEAAEVDTPLQFAMRVHLANTGKFGLADSSAILRTNLIAYSTLDPVTAATIETANEPTATDPYPRVSEVNIPQ